MGHSASKRPSRLRWALCPTRARPRPRSASSCSTTTRSCGGASGSSSRAERDIEVVGESGLAAEAIRRIPALRPDVAILDGRLPDGSGIDVCREVRSRDPKIKALILTSYDDDDALFAAIMAGAAGYMLKQVRGNDLVDTVRRVAAGQSMLDPAVTAQVLERLRNGPPVDKELEQLTAQERASSSSSARG